MIGKRKEGARSAEAGSRRSLALLPWLAPVAGGLAVVAGLLLGWQAFGAFGTERAAAAVDAARDRLIAELAALPVEPRDRVGEALGRADVAGAAADGDLDRAAELLKARLPGALAAEVHDRELSAAYEAGVQAFGFAKLSLLNAAARSGAVELAFGRDGQRVVLEFAGPVRDNGSVVALAFARMPLPDLGAMVAERAPQGGYLAVRANRATLAESGDPRHVAHASSAAVPGVPLQVLAGATPTEPLLPIGAVGQLGLGALLLLGGLAAVAMWLKRQRAGTSTADEDEGGTSFAEAMAQREAAPAPEPVPARVAEPPAPPPAAGSVPVDRSIFRAYDVRGVVGRTLDAGVARLLGQAIGSLMADKRLTQVVVGRDGRLSGPELSEALIAGLREAGRDVIDIGQAPTPVVYFATYHLDTGCGVVVTGSHNPPDYNGFKIVVGGETLSGEAIQDLYGRIAEGRMTEGGGGGLQHLSVDDDYVERIAGDIQLERRLKVVVDAGNGVAGGIAPRVLESIGCEVLPLYCEVDGTFPNHHPDPSEPANLADLITTVKKLDADLGLAFDGDGDRLGVVTREGEAIFPDRLLMLFAQDVLMRNPGASVIYDVKCTGHLAGHILRHGGSPIMWKTGHSLIKAKMRETDAELAGEMSGHFFFRERWYGFDDGIYSAARLLEILAADERDPGEIFSELPKGASTPELKVPMEEGAHYAFIERFRASAKFEGAKVSTIDGVRADWPDGWGLVRASNTTPVLVLRFDADDSEALARIQQAFRERLLAVDASLELPF